MIPIALVVDAGGAGYEDEGGGGGGGGGGAKVLCKANLCVMMKHNRGHDDAG
jgi:hypothetical protein